MFIGHYAAAVAAKAAEPRAPLWSYFLCAQLVDVGWSVLVAAGVEKVRMGPDAAVEFYHMPWTHSLPAAATWAVVGGLLLSRLLQLPATVGAFLGLTIFSHWVLDLLTHRAELELWIGGPKLGFGLGNLPVVQQALEMGLLACGAMIWAAYRVRSGSTAWPAVALVAFLVLSQIAVIVGPTGGGVIAFAVKAILLYGLFTVAAFLTELGDNVRR